MRLCSLLLLAACSDAGGATDLSAADLSATADLGADLSAGPACSTAVAPCSCPTPDSGHLCIRGLLFDFVANRPTAPSGPLRVSAYDPLQLLSDPMAAQPLACSLPSASGCFVLDGIVAPPGALVTIVAGDDLWVPAGQRDYYPSAVSIDVAAGQNGYADVYLIPRALMAKWMSSADTNYVQNGVLMMQFFDSLPLAQPAALGDTAYAAGFSVGGARYLAARDTVGPTTLTATQPGVGAAILLPPSGVPSIGGVADGGRTCGATQISTSMAGIVLVLNFYCN